MESISDLKSILENKQELLSKEICLDNKIDINKLNVIAGVDLAYWNKDNKEYACCCIVLIDFKTLNVIEKKYCVGEINVPYIPGCLAFREFELVEKTVKLLENDVDIYVFDGNGYLHPRHMGLATYAGIMLKKPSIEVAKSFYKFAEVDYSDIENIDFAYKDIIINNETYGRVLRTHKDVKPIFLSIGNMIDLETLTSIVKRVTTSESRIPVPTRYADIMTHEVRKKYSY